MKSLLSLFFCLLASIASAQYTAANFAVMTGTQAQSISGVKTVIGTLQSGSGGTIIANSLINPAIPATNGTATNATLAGATVNSGTISGGTVNAVLQYTGTDVLTLISNGSFDAPNYTGDLGNSGTSVGNIFATALTIGGVSPQMLGAAMNFDSGLITSDGAGDAFFNSLNVLYIHGPPYYGFSTLISLTQGGNDFSGYLTFGRCNDTYTYGGSTLDDGVGNMGVVGTIASSALNIGGGACTVDYGGDFRTAGVEAIYNLTTDADAFMPNLPIVDPETTGQLWNNAGAVVISGYQQVLTGSTGAALIVIDGTSYYPHVTAGVLTFTDTP